MSQNANTLLLVFDDASVQKDCFSMFDALNECDLEQASTFAHRLGIDIAQTWQEEWFNHELAEQPGFIRVDYDSSTRYFMPLDVLQQLFSCGLTGAALEIFHSQVGEYSQLYFMDSTLVEKNTLLEKHPQFANMVQDNFQCPAEQAQEEEDLEKPVSIRQLVKDEKRKDAEGLDLAKAFVEMAKCSSGTGNTPEEILDAVEGIYKLRAMGKGLLYALMFGVVTVLLFEGMWLWVSISIVLAFVLPIYFIAQWDDDESNEIEAVET